MPNSFVKEVAKQSGTSKHKVEKEFKKGEEEAKHKNIRNKYATEIVERMNPSYHPKTEGKRKPSGE